jgi:cytidyltransferase-like protein
MRISDLSEQAQNMDMVVIYPGRFQPFHKGHAAVYKWLAKKFKNVFIATSNVVAPPRSPFTFNEKKRMIMHAGVPANAIVQVKNPYSATEITDRVDPNNTIAVLAVSEKDMSEDPRFQFKPKKDGSPSYYQRYGGEMQPLSKHGYIIVTPTFDFTVLGEPMRSATELRKDFASADHQTQAEIIKDLYGKYDPDIHKIMAAKIASI